MFYVLINALRTIKVPPKIWLFFLVFGLISCSEDDRGPVEIGDFEVVSYYVIPADEELNEFTINNIERFTQRMQSWYLVATGGITFECAKDEQGETVRVYRTRQAKEFYDEDWWNKLLQEMIAAGLPVNHPGTVASIWIEGVEDLETGVRGFGQDLCDGFCGVSMIGTDRFFGPGRENNIIISIHELGHAFGLVHPVEVDSENRENPIYSSVMAPFLLLEQPIIGWLGFLTHEKELLYQSPFLKKASDVTLDLTSHRILNYPVTDSIPGTNFGAEVSGKTVQILDSTENAAYYFWEFGDGQTSSESAPRHIYGEQGRYVVRLTATSEGFMSGQNSRVISVE